MAILGEDQVSDRVLETLLWGVGYVARFVEEPVPSELGELLSDIRVVILPSALGARDREALLASLASTAETAGSRYWS